MIDQPTLVPKNRCWHYLIPELKELKEYINKNGKVIPFRRPDEPEIEH